MKKLTALVLAITMLLTVLSANVVALENVPGLGDWYSDYNLGIGWNDSFLLQSGMYDILPMALDGPTSGQCGDDVYWSIDEDTKVLTIYGSGDMYDFDNGAPWKDSDFQSVCITDQVTSIGDYAFWDNRIIDSVEILSDVTIIGEGAFYDCESLKSITLPDSVTTIENRAFLASWRLENITLSDSLCYIGDRAFDMCNLNSVDFPESLTYIGDSAFSGCNLEPLNLPDSLTHIGAGAFADNDLICNVFISKNITYIGSGAFSGIGSIVVDSNNPYYFVENDMLLTHEADGLRIIWIKPTLTGSLTLSSDITHISDIPDGITELTILGNIPDTNFGIPYNLESVTFASVPVISRGTFAEHYSLSKVSLPDNLVEIQYDAFEYCKSLKEIVIPASVKNIGDRAFDKTDSVYFEGNAPKVCGIDEPVGDNSSKKYIGTFSKTATLYYKPGTTGWTDTPDYDPATGKWKGYTIKPWENSDPGKVTALYPANGTVDFGYDDQNYYKVGFEKMTMTFDKVLLAGDKTGFNYETYAPLDFSKGNISIYRADGKLIWEASPTSFSECAGDVKILWGGMTLEITPSNKYMLFDYNTEYYVVIDPGVIKFDNGTTFAGIKKGEWTFTTVDEKLDHEHKSNGWESDDTSHWHTCEICGRRYDVEEHRRDDNCKCTVCGKTAHMPASIVVDAKEPTCMSNGYTGDRYCLLCHKIVEPGKTIPAYGHDLHWVSDPNSSIHWETCKRCKAKLSYDNHKFENKKCVVCGAPERYTPKEFTDFVWTLVNKHRPDLNSLPSPRTFHISNANWCDQFVSQSASICGLNSIIYGSGSTGYGVKAIYDNIIKAGGTEIMNIGKGIYGEPQMGDIVIFDWPEGNDSTGYYWSKGDVYEHIGIVVKVENGKIYTVHGNYHTGNGINGTYVCGPANSQLGVTACQANKSSFGQTWDIRYSKLASTKEGGGRIYAYVRPNWSEKANGIATNVVITIPGYAHFKITYGDEILSSPQQELMTLDLNAEAEEYDSNNTSFGTYSIDENGNYIITLDYHTDYGFDIYSVTNDKIDVDIKYLDFYDNILNEVSFKNVEVTDTTTIETSPFNEFGGYSLYLVDGEKDVIGWSAGANETVAAPDAEFTEYLNYGEENQPDVEETAQSVLPAHSHVFTSWQYDSVNHWRVCIDCGLKSNVYAHTFEGNVCTVCGYMRASSEEPETVPDDDGTVDVNVPTESKKTVEELSGAISDIKRKR